MARNSRPLAIVTGASSGIGFELAKLCATEGYNLLLAADTDLTQVANVCEELGASVTSVHADLSTPGGVEAVLKELGDSHAEALFANAGHGLGHAFLDQSWKDIRHVIDTNVTGTVYLIHAVAGEMRTVNRGRILITGSIAGFQPGSYQAVYNASKAFIDSFALALRDELKETEVTVSCLMPGVTDTEFFWRADMLDTKVATGKKMDPAEVAKIGFDAMMEGEADVVAGWKNKLQVAMSNLATGQHLAAQHAKVARPGSAE
jgi:short-subunit dehydrogenase